MRLRGIVWKSWWKRPLLRTGLLFAGAASVLAWAVVSCIAVFTEPGSDDALDTWLAVGVVVSCLATGLLLSIMVTNPGWPSGLAGAAVAIGSGVAGWLVYSAMPDPGGVDYIPHRLALAAFGYGFGVLGGGLIVLGELVTDGKVPEPNRRPPGRVTFRVALAVVVLVGLVTAAGVPGVHEWTDAANTDASRSRVAAPAAATVNLGETKVAGTAAGGLGSAGGLLTLDQSGDSASVAVTMRDGRTGDERWHYRQWNRLRTAEPVMSTDERRVGLSGMRRDDPSRQYATVLDTVTGARVADTAVGSDPGDLTLVTDRMLVYRTGSTSNILQGRDYDGDVAWTYRQPDNCAFSAINNIDNRLVVGLACRADTSTKDHARIQALDVVSGARQWEWRADAIGQIDAHGLVVTPDLVIADVRRDASGNDSLFAARKYRHDLNAVSLTDGDPRWRRENLNLGNTYAPACAGTLQLAGSELRTGRVVVGECHQDVGKAGATFDVFGYALADGSGVYKGKAELGYAPSRGVDTSRWFAGLADGRVVLTSDASSNLKKPDCRMYVVGPDSSGQHKDVQTPDGLSKSPWCQSASIHVTPDSVAVTYPTGGGGGGDATAPGGEYFAFG